MKEPLSVLSFAMNSFVVEAFHNVILELRMRGIPVDHVGISLNNWYPGDGFAAFQQRDYPSRHFPRPSGLTTPWHLSKEIKSEFSNSLPHLRLFLDEVLSFQKPSAIFLADDTGPIEKEIVHFFNSQKIPIFLFEHGPFFAFNLEKKEPSDFENLNFRHWKQTFAFLMKRFLRRPLPRPFISSSKGNSYCFGTYGTYTIFGFSQISKKILVKHGVPQKAIVDSGFPYFDSFFGAPPTSSLQPTSLKKKRILLFSNWKGRHGFKEYNHEIFSLILNVAKCLRPYYDLFLRYKPGESPEETLPEEILSELNQLGLLLDDNNVPSRISLPRFDLVIGPPSILGFEAILCKKPYLMLRSNNSIYSNLKVSYESIFKEFIQIVSLGKGDDVFAIVRQAFSKNYFQRISSNLFQHGKFLFNGLDGLSSKRVVNALLERLRADA